MDILAQRWFPIGDIGVGVFLPSHIGSILVSIGNEWHWQYTLSRDNYIILDSIEGCMSIYSMRHE